MMLPDSFLQSLKDVKGFDRLAFEAVHAQGRAEVSIRLNPAKLAMDGPPSALPDDSLQEKISGVFDTAAVNDQRFIKDARVPWCDLGYYLSRRPSFTFDPLFHAGCYYVQEASSMFLEYALKQTVDLSKPLKVLDLSAAPGGKSTHIQSLITSNSLLVSNEVIKSRTNILKDNMIKWGSNNVVVTNNDPRDFGKLPDYFDVMVVDAPCSGSGLIRREPEAANHWSA